MVVLEKLETIVAFTVPYLIPPSGGHYKIPVGYGHDRKWKGFVLTKEAKAYYDAVAIFAKGRSVTPLDPCERRKARYAVRVDVYLGPKQRGDFDNFWKCALDSLVRAGVINTDAAVDGEQSKCVVHKDQRTNPRTEYTVIRLEK